MTDKDPRAAWQDLGAHIREQRRQAELSVRKLADLANVSNPYLSQIERGLKRPSAEILQQIARALEISSETLYVRAGILDAEPGAGDLTAEIRRDPWLTEEQKRTLVQIYESFQAERRAAGFGPDVTAASPSAPAADEETEATAVEDAERESGANAERS